MILGPMDFSSFYATLLIFNQAIAIGTARVLNFQKIVYWAALQIICQIIEVDKQIIIVSTTRYRH